jgi:hypothetical protein
MTISSRTPEGWPGRCPTCGHPLRVEPSPPTGDATCPRCGCLVWLPRPASSGRAWWGTRLLASFLAVGAGWLLLLVGRRSGLHGPEVLMLTVLSTLLFGRRLPALVRWFIRPLGAA